MPSAVGFDPANYETTSSTAFQLGGRYEYAGKTYMFVAVFTANTSNGAVMCAYDTTGYGVIGANRVTALTGTPTATQVKGVALGVVTAGRYGFILTRGVHTAVQTTAATLGRWVCAAATNDSCTDASASPLRTEIIFGVAMTTTGAPGTVTVDVRC